MEISDILSQNDRVYIDTCKIAELSTQEMSEEERAKLVVTPSVSEEYFAMNQRNFETDKFVESLDKRNIHKIASESGNRSQTYFSANTLFISLALKTLRQDLQNNYIERINELDQKRSKEDFYGEIAKRLSKLLFATIGLAGLSYLDKFPVSDFMANKVNKEYGKRLNELKQEESPEELFKRANKKRRRWIRKNLENIVKEIGFPFFDPIKVYNYTDADLVTLAAIDSQTKGYNTGIWTADKDFKGYFKSMKEICEKTGSSNSTGEKSRTSLYLKPNEKTKQQSINIPDNIDSLADTYIQEELMKTSKDFRDVLYKVRFYQEVNPRYELFKGVTKGTLAGLGTTFLVQLTEKSYELYSNEILGDFFNGMYNACASGDIKAIQGTLLLSSMAFCLPSISYTNGKKAYKNIKKAMKYPNIEKDD